MKKILALILALTLALSLGAMAFAEETPVAPVEYTITAPSGTGHTYEIYQIFTGDYFDGILSNLVWGENGTGTTGSAVADATLEALTALSSTATDTEKLAVIEGLVSFSNPVATIASGASAQVPGGYYLIKDKESTVTENDVFSLNVVQVVDDVAFAVKGDVPEVVKKILDTAPVDENEASIGDVVNYSITGTMPSNISDYVTYYYEFKDTMSKGLTYNKDMVITVNGVDVTSYFYKNSEVDSDGTNITASIQDILNLKKIANVGTITKDTQVIVTYTATLNEDAVIAGEGNSNKVKLDYYNNPNDSGTGEEIPENPPEYPPENPPEPPVTPPDPPVPTHPTGNTPEDEVKTYTTEITVKKTDGENPLTGAEFTLKGDGVNVVIVKKTDFVEDDEGTYWKLKDGKYTTTEPTIAQDATDNQADYASVVKKYKMVSSAEVMVKDATSTNVKAYVDENGEVTFTGLGAGTYTLTESVVPAGYNKADDVVFTIGFSKDEDGNVIFTSDNDSVVVGDDNKLDTTVVNQSGAVLPETGGIGTTIFYIVGAVLVAGAAIVLFARKRVED